jgi:cysteine synthase A
VLDAVPEEWRGTTFKNHDLQLRGGFIERLDALVANTAQPITEQSLLDLGNAEDYLRVATNLSVVLERALALRGGLEPEAVLTFASTTMPIVSVAMTCTGRRVHVYYGADGQPPLSQHVGVLLDQAGCDLKMHAEAPPAAGSRPHGDNDIVVALASVVQDRASVEIDALVSPCVLYIVRTDRISPADVLVIRKRMSTPVTTPVAEAMLRALADGGDLDAAATVGVPPSDDEVQTFYKHLQTLSGVEEGARYVVDAKGKRRDVETVACFTAGLPTLASLWLSLGSVDILMCSTAYGGSSQLVDLLVERSSTVGKHTFDIQGSASIVPSIGAALQRLGDRSTADMNDILVLFVEVPTNPDMKVPDLGEVAKMLQAYQTKTGSKVLLLVDGTFAPGSEVTRKVREVAPALPCIVFLSMSKSVSRGTTTAGALIANDTDEAKYIVSSAYGTGVGLDTLAKPDQVRRLVDNHVGVEDRCAKAYHNARELGIVLQDAVRAAAPGNPEMALAFVKDDHAALGFTTSTFSFNLPPRAGADAADSAGLAQRFVDALCRDKTFKPCVSFGQDNGLVYATVPATSTQGAIKDEDKAKQAVGGVQLTRLSFPPTLDLAAVGKTLTDAVKEMYA